MSSDQSAKRLYDGADPRDVPLYTLPEAARYLRIPTATVRSWLRGRTYPKKSGDGYFEPVVQLPAGEVGLLSFTNLVELHVLRSLRGEHGVPLPHVRAALTFAEKQLGLERLLVRRDLMTAAGDVFLERYGQLINLSQSGQLAVQMVLREHLKRVEWDAWSIPVRLFPFVPQASALGAEVPQCPVVIDPRVSFGRPTLVGTGVTTGAIVRRVDAGEAVDDVAEDYDISASLVRLAVLYEQAA